MYEDLFCPECEEPLKEEDLKKSLVCPHCKTDLKQNQYRNFLEFLIAQEIIDNIDFFDMDVYGEEILKEEPLIESDEIDPSDYEKKRIIDAWDELEEEEELEEELFSDEDLESSWYPLNTDEIEDLDSKPKSKSKKKGAK